MKSLFLLLAAAVSFETLAPVGFVLQNDPTPRKRQIETMAGGVAVIDYDGDGLPDVFFANGAPQPNLAKASPKYYNRLYRNLGNFRFEDVTDRAGVRGEGYSIGAASADYDNDGRPDLFVYGVNRNILYRNRGDGTFEDVTARSGIRSGLWTIGAGWFDYGNDGRLDLFVVNYVHWGPATEPACGEHGGKYRTYCHPKMYEGLANTLYRNNGDGTFTDVSERSGIAKYTGKGMAVLFADYDLDGRMDVFVTNDTQPNFLFHNEGDGTFREVSVPAGVAFNDDGRALSFMGGDFRDTDNDGLPDLFVTALPNETFPLYRNLGRGLFADMTYPSRIGAISLPLGGWSTGIYDFDNDGWKDIFVAGADVQDNTELFSSRKSRLPNLLLRNNGKGVFEPEFVGSPALHRGAAFADFDLDGRVDAVVTRLGETPEFFRNTLAPGNHWLAVRLEGQGIGARVHVRSACGEQWNHATTAVGYASSSETPVHFGLGSCAEADLIEIAWPSGKRSRLDHVRADRYLTVREP